MTEAMHKIGIDANRPVHVRGARVGGLTDTVADPAVIASTGAGWVRLNFVLGPWAAPEDSREWQGHTWMRAYHRIIDQFRDNGLQIYGLISGEAVRTDLDGSLNTMFRQPEAATSEAERARGHAWIQQYAANFGRIVQEFHDKVDYFESFNEPDDWHGMEGVNWIHPTWFAHMMQAIHDEVKERRGLTDVKLITGPLLGHHHHQPAGGAPAHQYIRTVYETGQDRLGWGDGRYPFDGIGYHLYLQPGFTHDWENHARAVEGFYEDFTGGMLAVIREFEDADSRRQLFISEMGWTSEQYDERHFDFQARNVTLALRLLTDDPNVGLGFWFCTQDFVDGQGNKFYGLYRRDRPIHQAHKPAYQAFQAFCAARFGG